MIQRDVFFGNGDCVRVDLYTEYLRCTQKRACDRKNAGAAADIQNLFSGCEIVLHQPDTQRRRFMRAGTECHARIDLKDLFIRLCFVCLPGRLDNDGLADLGWFEIRFPVILPRAVVLAADLRFEAADIKPTAEASACSLCLKRTHGCTDSFCLLAPRRIIVQIDGDPRCFVL